MSAVTAYPPTLDVAKRMTGWNTRFAAQHGPPLDTEETSGRQ